MRLKGQPENGNSHTLLMAQRSLLDIVKNIPDDEGQIDAIHAELSLWCKELFADKELLKAFRTIKPY